MFLQITRITCTSETTSSFYIHRETVTNPFTVSLNRRKKKIESPSTIIRGHCSGGKTNRFKDFFRGFK